MMLHSKTQLSGTFIFITQNLLTVMTIGGLTNLLVTFITNWHWNLRDKERRVA